MTDDPYSCIMKEPKTFKLKSEEILVECDATEVEGFTIEDGERKTNGIRFKLLKPIRLIKNGGEDQVMLEQRKKG